MLHELQYKEQQNPELLDAPQDIKTVVKIVFKYEVQQQKKRKKRNKERWKNMNRKNLSSERKANGAKVN